MTAMVQTKDGLPEVLNPHEVEKPAFQDNKNAEAFTELERGVQAATDAVSSVNSLIAQQA